MAAVLSVPTAPVPTPTTVAPTPTTPWTTDNATAALLGMAAAPARAGSSVPGSTPPGNRPATSGTPAMPTPGRAAELGTPPPPPPSPGEPNAGTPPEAGAAAPPGSAGPGGVTTLPAGSAPACAAGADAPDGAGVSGIRTDATLSHITPLLPQVVAVCSGVLTEVSGVTASVPPRRAEAAAPRTAILMTVPSGCRLAMGAGQSQKLRRTRLIMRAVSRNSWPGRRRFS